VRVSGAQLLANTAEPPLAATDTTATQTVIANQEKDKHEKHHITDNSNVEQTNSKRLRY
jgi:hypothetical protein